jgi:hypothetical protein
MSTAVVTSTSAFPPAEEIVQFGGRRETHIEQDKTGTHRTASILAEALLSYSDFTIRKTGNCGELTNRAREQADFDESETSPLAHARG